MHIRKQVRDAVVARLKTDVPAVGNRVFGNRAKPMFRAELPCILVYSDEETAEVSVESPREYARALKISIEVVDKAEPVGSGDNVLDDQIDALCEAVELSVFKEETFGGLVADTYLVETTMALLEEGEKPIGAAKITLNMPYFQQLPGEVTITTPLEKVDTKIDLPPADGAIESEDLQNLPQV